LILELDVGNTCIKWRLDQSGVVSIASDLDELAVALDGLSMERVRVASVRSAEFDGRLRVLLQRRFAVDAEFALSLRSCGDVRTDYQYPERLGVDRWLAVLAAHATYTTDALVVDCGSAVTMDYIDVSGVHRGGYIVPGLRLMRRALAVDTAAVQVAPGAAESACWGTTTEMAVNNGILDMVVGGIQRVVRQSGSGDAPLTLVLTGGDAQALQQYLSDEAADLVLHESLVLDGLAISLP